MIGSLLYLNAGKPDIIFNVGLCARFQENPKESHLAVVKRLLRYLKVTTDLCLLYPKGSNFNIVGYADTDYTGFLVDRKSTSGMADFLGLCLVSWATKKQNSVVLSTVEAEYVVAASYSFKSATHEEESGSSETKQVSSDSKVSPETISKVAAN
ncbi:secreted RxLR effector protein 161-like [Nicotiana tabacum]|uniref:Secreted RxLR effector protein 161-like n=1 Tax=Nicotiana tabacum TaxID=4097 RepID=A0AC58RVG6_TOBAC